MIGSCHGLICNCLEELGKQRNTLIRMDDIQADMSGTRNKKFHVAIKVPVMQYNLTNSDLTNS
jgi:hypothetical protein